MPLIFFTCATGAGLLARGGGLAMRSMPCLTPHSVSCTKMRISPVPSIGADRSFRNCALACKHDASVWGRSCNKASMQRQTQGCSTEAEPTDSAGLLTASRAHRVAVSRQAGWGARTSKNTVACTW